MSDNYDEMWGDSTGGAPQSPPQQDSSNGSSQRRTPPRRRPVPPSQRNGADSTGQAQGNSSDGWSDSNSGGWGDSSGSFDNQGSNDWDTSGGGNDAGLWDNQQETFEPAQSMYSGMDGDSGQMQDGGNFGGEAEHEQFEELNNSPVLEPRQFNFSKKQIAIILAFICIVIALVFVFFDNINFTKNDKQQQVQVQQGGQATNNDNTVNVNNGNNNANNNNGSVVFIEIPEDTSLNYSGDVLTTSGTVVNKVKYLCGHQVIYCINIRIAVGSSAEEVAYYCNYSSFQSVGSGDIVTLTYQQVADGYISVNSISK